MIIILIRANPSNRSSARTLSMIIMLVRINPIAASYYNS